MAVRSVTDTLLQGIKTGHAQVAKAAEEFAAPGALENGTSVDAAVHIKLGELQTKTASAALKVVTDLDKEVLDILA
jgi:hypothetical protein